MTTKVHIKRMAAHGKLEYERGLYEGRQAGLQEAANDPNSKARDRAFHRETVIIDSLQKAVDAYSNMAESMARCVVALKEMLNPR